MTVSIGFGLVTLFPRMSPASGMPPGGAASAPYLTSIADDQGNVLVIHAVLTATPTHRVNVTTHPIEKGNPITDHARTENVRLTMECVVTNTPLSPDFGRMVFSRGQTFASNTEKDHPPGEAGPAEEAYKWLVDLVNSPRIVTVSRQRAEYANMLVVSVSEQETSQNGDALRFTVELQEAIFATVKKIPSKVSLSKPKKKGAVTPKKTDPPKNLDPLEAVTGITGT